MKPKPEDTRSEKPVVKRAKKPRPKNSTKPGMKGRIEIHLHIEGEGE